MTKLEHGIFFGFLPNELIVDNFAGGGGASLGIEMALGRSPDIAINHDAEAITMHSANHPNTKHYCEDVWEVNPVEACAGRPVGLAWFSPDCKHFSKAKGGKPVSKKIRGLAWIVVKWAKAVQPRVIILENVEEFQDWGPLDDEGMPCRERKGVTFQRWLAQLRNLGYIVEWRELRACDYSAPTIRKRLFIVARRDDQRIVWPQPTHASPKKIGTDLFTAHLKPWRTAAECIDWSIPCPSIFDRKKPLAENTLRRIAAGIQRYVIGTAEPFIVNLTHHGSDRVEGLDEPFRTVTGAKRGEKALVMPYFVGAGGPARSGEPREAGKPFGTQTAKNNSRLVAAFLAATSGPSYSGKPRPVDQPVNTLTADARSALVASHLVKLRGTCRDGQPITEPMATISAQGLHLAEVRAFLIKYFGTDQDPRLEEPMHTVTAKHRFGLVTIYGEDYVIADIGLRMLSPRELYRAQGFHDGYVIDPVFEGKPLSKTAQVRMCGNSVCPPNAAAMVRAQFGMAPAELAA
jgi:DNA (cytosine-5)-methyltransferase 1